MTTLALVLFCWRRDFVDLGSDDELWREVQDAVGGARRKDARLHGGTLFEAFARMRKHYHLPEDWRTLRKYFGLVIRDMRRASRRTPSCALVPYVSRATFFRLKAKVRPEGGRLTESELAELRRHVDRKQLRRTAMELLADSRDKAAARKYVYRYVSGGGEIGELVKRLRRMRASPPR